MSLSGIDRQIINRWVQKTGTLRATFANKGPHQSDTGLYSIERIDYMAGAAGKSIGTAVSAKM